MSISYCSHGSTYLTCSACRKLMEEHRATLRVQMSDSQQDNRSDLERDKKGTPNLPSERL